MASDAGYSKPALPAPPSAVACRPVLSVRTRLKKIPSRFRAVFALVCLCVGLPSSARAAPLLRCEVSYAGVVHPVVARPVSDPYPVESVAIGERFAFKAVMVGTDAKLERIAVYVYAGSPSRLVMIQEAKYLPPYRSTQQPYSLTGVQRLYAGPMERELTYHCTLEGVAP
jgi:hypothetical protein